MCVSNVQKKSKGLHDEMCRYEETRDHESTRLSHYQNREMCNAKQISQLMATSSISENGKCFAVTDVDLILEDPRNSRDVAVAVSLPADRWSGATHSVFASDPHPIPAVPLGSSPRVSTSELRSAVLFKMCRVHLADRGCSPLKNCCRYRCSHGLVRLCASWLGWRRCLLRRSAATFALISEFNRRGWSYLPSEVASGRSDRRGIELERWIRRRATRSAAVP